MRQYFQLNPAIPRGIAPHRHSHRRRQMPAILLLGLTLWLAFWLWPTQSQAGAPTFDTYRAFGTGLDDTRSVAVGDMDGDGDLDIVTGNKEGPNAVYLNDGNGDFPLADARSFGPGDDYTLSVALGDVDGDGDLDIITGNFDQQNVIYLNDGTGNLDGSRNFGPAVSSTVTVGLGDVDGDGDLDIVAGNVGANTVYLNNGAGTFDDTNSFGSSGDSTLTVAIGNLDSDAESFLDLAVGNGGLFGQQDAVYLNDGLGGFPSGNAHDFGPSEGITHSVVVGDMDGDGDLDIVAGTRGGQNAIYLNGGNGDFSETRNFGSGGDLTLSVAVGDVDSDGDLDIVAGDEGGANVVYLNNGAGNFYTSAVDCGSPPQNARCFGSGHDVTPSVALGDVDGDGHLDIIVGNGGPLGRQNAVYLNNGAGNFPVDAAGPFGIGDDVTLSVALGDVDDDGDLDIVAGDNAGQDAVFLNKAGEFYVDTAIDCSLRESVQCFGTGDNATRRVAVGDMDGNDHIDIVAVSDTELNAVYLNNGAGRFDLAGNSKSFGTAGDATLGVAVGDMDSDGDLDIVTGDDGGQNRIYLNNGAADFTSSRSFGPGNDATLSVAVGDLNGDAHLDIVAGNDGRNAVYLNDGQGQFYAGIVDCDALPDTVRCFGNALDPTHSLAVGDIDGDGDLDIVTGNDGEINVIYLNDGLGNFDWSGSARGFGTGSDETYSVAVGDIDGDGDLDIVVGNVDQQNTVHLNNGEGYFSDQRTRVFGDAAYDTVAVALGDVDGDGDLDIVSGNSGQPNRVEINHAIGAERLANNPPGVAIRRPGPTANASFFSTPRMIADQFIPIPYTLHDADGDPVGRVAAYYSLDGGGLWYTATATSDTPTTNLMTGLFPSPTLTNTHVFTWDTFASGVFGQSDNVVFRLEAYPQPFYTGVTNSYSFTKTVPGPFQRPYAASTTYPFRVRGTQIRVLSGTVPISNAMVYRLPSGQTTGGILMTDSAGRPYRTDPLGYMQGRPGVAIGDALVAMLPITWTDSSTLYYTNAIPRPVGLDAYTITAPGVQTLTVSSANTLILFNLDVSLEWDARRDGQFLSQLQFDLQRTSEILYDWTNGQAALGQVTVYHDRENWLDSHIRIYASNRMRPSATQGGMVSDIITDPVTSTLTYGPGQIHIGAIWNRFGEPDGKLSEDWPRTLAHELGHYSFFLDDNYLGLDEDRLLIPVETCPGAMSDPYRVDDASGYDEFHHGAQWEEGCGTTLAAQTTGRWDWQTITEFYPQLNGVITNTGPSGLPLAVTEIQVVEPVTPTSALEVPIFYLTQDGGRVQPGTRARAVLFQEDRMTDLGRPTLDQVNARGARPGDRVCVYELTAGRLGCEIIKLGDEQMALHSFSDWKPDVIITPVTSRTVSINVTGVPTDLSLNVRVYPLNDSAPSSTALTLVADIYSGTVNLENPTLAGHVHVWVNEPEPRREIVTDYTLGGSPGLMRGSRGLMRGSRGLMRGSRAPAVSADGHVILYGENLDFEDGEFFTLQAATNLPSAPPWTTVVGQSFRLSTSANAPDLSGTSLSFNYLGAEVPPGEEDWLRVYYWDGADWRRLRTQLDTYYNVASAPTQGEGLYALMTNIEIPLFGAAWNTLPYPIEGTRPIEEALAPISGYYSIVYDRVVTDTLDPWKVYGPDAPDWVNDLKQMQFGRAYLIYVTETVTLPLKGGSTNANIALSNTLPIPPATYYGMVAATGNFTPTVGMTVSALITDKLCGQTQTQEIDDQIVYVIEVLADDLDGAIGCGTLGRTVKFYLESELMAPSVPWDNRKVAEASLQRLRVYLPTMLKVP